MIARFRILLPFVLHVVKPEDLASMQFETADGYGVTVLPPIQVPISPSDCDANFGLPLIEIGDQMMRSPNPSILTSVLKVNGTESTLCNAIQIDFKKDIFDRTGGMEIIDPPLPFIFELLNDYLQSLRAVTAHSQIKMLTSSSNWVIRYLNDDGSELAVQEGLFRRKSGTAFKMNYCGVDALTWEKVLNRPLGKKIPTWEQLHLDAISLLPEVGPALVLSYSALETFMNVSLDFFAKNYGLDPELWKWLNERDHFSKEPSMSERMKKLLKILGGKDLQSRQDFTAIFEKIKKIRNSYIHEGRLEWEGAELSVEDATKLIDGVGEIIAWISTELPAELQSDRLNRTIHYELSRMHTRPASQITADAT